MTTTVFVAGSMNIKHLNRQFVDRVANIVAPEFDIVVGDADGSDTSIQEALVELKAKRVTVYCSGLKPRNNVGGWKVHNVFPDAAEGTRAYFTAKDIEMAKAAHFGLMMWDAKSTGTLSNVIELLRRGKRSVVFVNKHKDFITVTTPIGLNNLVDTMSEGARAKANSKIGLASTLAGFARQQFSLPL
jgi:hypothetical protein